MKKSLIPLLVCFVFTYTLKAQKIEVESMVSATGLLAENNQLPFWLVANNNGALAPSTNGLFEASSKIVYDFNKNTSIEAKGSFFLRDGVTDKFQRNELFIRFKNKWVQATLGSENPQEKYNGLSVVDDNFLLAGNSRSIPGLLLETPKPLEIIDNFAVDLGIGHYELNDDRYVDDAKLHYKRLNVSWTFAQENTLVLGIEHYAQWSGNSPEIGKQPDSFSDFIDVFFARRAAEGSFQSDQANALGNHIGIYNFEYKFQPDIGDFSFYHQHPFEDGSGTRLKNFPDGIWGISYMPNTIDYTSFLTGLVLEYVQTTNQSGGSGRSGIDNYFNSGVYRSGWTYDANIIGLPFIYRDDTGLKIANNRLRAINLGFSAANKQWSYLFKTTYVENLGIYPEPIIPKDRSVYTLFKTQYDFEKLGSISLMLGYDFNDLRDDNYGGGLTYSYSF
ncbi:capsule assembly Wzi family protein [Marixanthomonas ophiurae]|nr:capsule assembly Wzi family protein [Marixanthomonas ophiurae]